MSSLDHIAIGIACSGVGAVAYGLYSRRNRSELPLPPGPRKLPLVGNVFDIPPTHPWETYMAWSKEYSESDTHRGLSSDVIF
jgi:hypothetical protein